MSQTSPGAGLTPSTAVTSIEGTENQVLVNGSFGIQETGDVVLSTPQDIATTSSPTFAGMTISTLTSGSVIFAGAGGLISQDNANLFWDDTNDRLGIRTNTPSRALEIVANTGGDGVVTLDSGGSGRARVIITGGGDGFIDGDDASGTRNFAFDAGGGGYYANPFSVGVQATPNATLYVSSTVAIGSGYSLTTPPTDGLSVEGQINADGGIKLSTFTAGSVLYIDSGTLIAQENANLFWDDSNDRLGINTNSPVNSLDINSNCAIGSSYAASSSAPSDGLIVEGFTGIITDDPDMQLHVIATAQGFYNNTAYPTNNMVFINSTYDGNWAAAGNTIQSSNVFCSNESDPSTGGNMGGVIGFGSLNSFGGYHVMYARLGTKRAGSFYGTLEFQTMHNRNDGTLRTDVRFDNGYVGIGTGNASTTGIATPATLLELEEDYEVPFSLSDGYSAALTLDPNYDANSASSFTITRHDYIDMNNVTATNAGAGTLTVTDAAIIRFDAAAGTHKAVDSGTTKTTPGTVDAWVKVNINGTLYYLPAYTSKTS